MLLSKNASSDKLCHIFHLFQPSYTFKSLFPSAALEIVEDLKLDFRRLQVDKEGCETFQKRSYYVNKWKISLLVFVFNSKLESSLHFKSLIYQCDILEWVYKCLCIFCILPPRTKYYNHVICSFAYIPLIIVKLHMPNNNVVKKNFFSPLTVCVVGR